MPPAVQHIRVIVDESIYGDVVVELHARGCLIESLEDEAGNKIVGAKVRGMDLESFAVWLDACSHGEGRIVRLPHSLP